MPSSFRWFSGLRPERAAGGGLSDFGLAVTTKDVVLVAIEAALPVESLLETPSCAVDANLGGGYRTPGDVGDLRGGLPLEVVEHQGRSVVLGQAVDDPAYAGIS
jgi:hypothetical protein